MSGPGRWLVLLLAALSLAVTGLLTFKVVSRQRAGVILYGTSSGPDAQHDPPILGTLPDFALTERSGASFGSAQLRGKIWIADFIFTRCAGPCPRMSAEMAGLQAALAPTPAWENLRLVSFTVDPQNDTPEALRAYAAAFHADAEHWLFLTGARPAIWELAKEGFKLPVGEDRQSGQMPIFHSTRLVLVDRLGRVRGYYEGLEADGRARLRRDVERLAGEKE